MQETQVKSSWLLLPPLSLPSGTANTTIGSETIGCDSHTGIRCSAAAAATDPLSMRRTYAIQCPHKWYRDGKLKKLVNGKRVTRSTGCLSSSHLRRRRREGSMTSGVKNRKRRAGEQNATTGTGTGTGSGAGANARSSKKKSDDASSTSALDGDKVKEIEPGSSQTRVEDEDEVPRRRHSERRRSGVGMNAEKEGDNCDSRFVSPPLFFSGWRVLARHSSQRISSSSSFYGVRTGRVQAREERPGPRPAAPPEPEPVRRHPVR